MRVTHWYVNGEEIHRSELDPQFWADVRIGEGVILAGAGRYVVDSVWHRFDHHGVMDDDGTHVILREVTDTDEDVPVQLFPNYFTD